MKRVIITGTDTDVGKTLVSAIFLEALQGEYWKPIQTGDKDKDVITKLLPNCVIHPESYYFDEHISPHHFEITPQKISPPQTNHPLIIEGCGGALCPITPYLLLADLFKSWDAEWFIVSKHRLGSLNHTLMTIEALQIRGCNIKGIIFNGPVNHTLESPILTHYPFPCVLRLTPQDKITSLTIKKYGKLWQPALQT